MATFKHHDLRLLNPSFDSLLLDANLELEHLRRLELRGSTPEPVFFQLKHVFHMLESFASARIEGNHTTLEDYVESKIAPKLAPKLEVRMNSDMIMEIENIEVAMQHVEDVVQQDGPISEKLIRELHTLTVKGLKREGDETPGAYRIGSVSISGSEHKPPRAVQVPVYMLELIEWMNRSDRHKYDLIKVALAHHRFAWIHPFRNGNGRVVRLLTYALLIKYGFRVNSYGRLLNPAAVFCVDRTRYYDMLAQADAGTDLALEGWCTYVLNVLLQELTKVSSLADYKVLSDRVLFPALNVAKERKWITPMEDAVLRATIRKQSVKAIDLSEAMPNMTSSQRTYQIRKLVTDGLLQPIYKGARQYTIGFANSLLLRGVVKTLTDEGFIPAGLAEPHQ